MGLEAKMWEVNILKKNEKSMWSMVKIKGNFNTDLKNSYKFWKRHKFNTCLLYTSYIRSDLVNEPGNANPGLLLYGLDAQDIPYVMGWYN